MFGLALRSGDVRLSIQTMTTRRFSCLGLLAVWLCPIPGRCGQGLPSAPNPPDPLLAHQIVARVLIFISNDCPIANRYCPEFRRLHQRYAPCGVAIWLVHSDPEETADSIREHDREYRLDLPSLRDPDQSLARLAKAQVVPSAAVFLADGTLVYHGRIDDRFAELGREHQEASQHDLENAIEAVLSKRPIKVSATKAVGCYIPGIH